MKRWSHSSSKTHLQPIEGKLRVLLVFNVLVDGRISVDHFVEISIRINLSVPNAIVQSV